MWRVNVSSNSLVHRLFVISGLCLSSLSLPCLAAEPAPVQPGLWKVRTLTTFDRSNGNSSGNGLQWASATRPEPSQPRSYVICLTEPRVRAPMMPSRLPRAAELAFDTRSIAGTYAEVLASGTRQQVEFVYRRIANNRFEGSQDVQADGRIVRLQYEAQRVAADCGTVKPAPLQASGEP
jgi:hypothetical protein